MARCDHVQYSVSVYSESEEVYILCKVKPFFSGALSIQAEAVPELFVSTERVTTCVQNCFFGVKV